MNIDKEKAYQLVVFVSIVIVLWNVVMFLICGD